MWVSRDQFVVVRVNCPWHDKAYFIFLLCSVMKILSIRHGDAIETVMVVDAIHCQHGEGKWGKDMFEKNDHFHFRSRVFLLQQQTIYFCLKLPLTFHEHRAINHTPTTANMDDQDDSVDLQANQSTEGEYSTWIVTHLLENSRREHTCTEWQHNFDRYSDAEIFRWPPRLYLCRERSNVANGNRRTNLK